MEILIRKGGHTILGGVRRASPCLHTRMRILRRRRVAVPSSLGTRTVVHKLGRVVARCTTGGKGVSGRSITRFLSVASLGHLMGRITTGVPLGCGSRRRLLRRLSF